MRQITASERRAAYRSDPVAFAYKGFEVLNNGRPVKPNWHHAAILRHVQKELPNQTTRLIINAPPRSFKSFLVSVAWVGFVLARDPGHKFVCARAQTH